MKNKKTTAKTKLSDRFWKETFMRVLEALYWNEATWSLDVWPQFGISNADRKKVEQEFERWMAAKAKKNLQNTNK